MADFRSHSLARQCNWGMAVNPRMLRTVLASAALIASAAAAAALASSRTAAPPPPPAPVPAPDPPQDEPPQDTAPVPVRRRRRLRQLLWLLLALVVIAAGIGSAVFLQAPSWVPWTLVGLTGVSAICLGIAFLIGPGARRLAGETTPLTAAEREQMTASERVEAVNAARHTLIQAATGLVVIGGVVFTALGLWYTARTVEYTARTVETAREGQITDRYTKAVEQLGSSKLDVRLGGIYALQRLASDSPRDKDTIRNVLAAFVRGHDLCTVPPGRKKPPKQCTTTTALKADLDTPRTRLAADVFAALIIAPTLATPRASRGAPYLVDFSRTRFPFADLPGANLNGADLTNTDLRGANLRNADLVGVDLRGATMKKTALADADLRGANLSFPIPRGLNTPMEEFEMRLGIAIAQNLGVPRSRLGIASADTGSFMAIPRSTDLRGADLSGADMRGANLLTADLSDANLSGADLSGADLSGVIGKTAAEIKAVAITDAKTKF